MTGASGIERETVLAEWLPGEACPVLLTVGNIMKLKAMTSGDLLLAAKIVDLPDGTRETRARYLVLRER